MTNSLFQIIDNKVEEIPVKSLDWSESDLTTTKSPAAHRGAFGSLGELQAR